MKIYTRTGDTGKTSLLGGTRVPKNHLRIDTYGTVDELNSWLGVLSDQAVNKAHLPFLERIQDRLFVIGSLLAMEPGKTGFALPELLDSDVLDLEQAIDQMNETLPPMKFFILPGGHESVSFGHVARTVCRRAERACITLNEVEAVAPIILQYLNRLSDYLFVLCRSMSQDLGIEDRPWKPQKSSAE